jgi:hypothetical protein
MALAKGTNSYVTLSEANAYLLDRLSAEVWLNVSDPDRERALMTATRMLDELEWIGYPIDENQALAFPRVGTYYDTKQGRSVSLPTSVPSDVLRACNELALHLLNNTSTMNAAATVESLSVGSIQLNTIRPVGLFPSRIKRMLKQLLKNGVAQVWWRAN